MSFSHIPLKYGYAGICKDYRCILSLNINYLNLLLKYTLKTWVCTAKRFKKKRKKENQAYGNEFEITRLWQDKKLRDEYHKNKIKHQNLFPKKIKKSSNFKFDIRKRFQTRTNTRKTLHKKIPPLWGYKLTQGQRLFSDTDNPSPHRLC